MQSEAEGTRPAPVAQAGIASISLTEITAELWQHKKGLLLVEPGPDENIRLKGGAPRAEI